MRDKEFKELWEMRFRKIFKLEKEGFLFYRHLLRRNKALFSGTQAKNVLERLALDELRHARMVQVLMKIVRNKKTGAQD